MSTAAAAANWGQMFGYDGGVTLGLTLYSRG
jgi:hypothetical protein